MQSIAVIDAARGPCVGDCSDPACEVREATFFGRERVRKDEKFAETAETNVIFNETEILKNNKTK